jgi:hypothetical protein
MQRYRFTDYYDSILEVVVNLLMETTLYNMQDLPNVSNNQPLEERDTGDKKYIKVKWNVHGQIPPIAQKLVKPEMLTFIEDSVWDRKTFTYSTKIIPNFFRNQINCQHKLEFLDNKDGRTKRIMSGYFEFKVPVIGPIFETFVIKYLKQNAEEDFKIGNNALKKYIKEHGTPDFSKKADQP